MLSHLKWFLKLKWINLDRDINANEKFCNEIESEVKTLGKVDIDRKNYPLFSFLP